MDFWDTVNSSNIIIDSITTGEDNWYIDITLQSTVIDYKDLVDIEFENGTKVKVTLVDNKSFNRSAVLELELAYDDYKFVRRALNLMRDQIDREIED